MLTSFRSALGSLRASRGFTFAAILSLAIGIGGTITIFSIVNAIVLRPLDYPDPERLVSVIQIDPKQTSDIEVLGLSPNQFQRWRREIQSFQSIAIACKDTANLTGAGDPETLGALRISAQFLDTLQVRPQLGRWFYEWEEKRGSSGVVILSDSLWRRKFSADPNIVGRKILLGGTPHEVVGIASPHFWLFRGRQLNRDLVFPDRLDIFIPLQLTPREEKGEPSFAYVAIARLRPGVTPGQARAELQSTIPTFTYENNEKIYPRVEVHSLQSTLSGRSRKALFLLSGAVSFVLLIVCVNVTNLLLVRAIGRRRELAIRFALGASRGHILRDSLAESLTLSAIAAASGLLLSWWAMQFVVSWAPVEVARFEQTKIDTAVIVFTLVLTLSTTVIFGVLPAWWVTGMAPVRFLRAAGRGSTEDTRGTRVRLALVAFEAALGTVLLISAGLFLISFQNILNTERGFRPENVLALDFSLPPSIYGQLEHQAAFFRRVKDGIVSVPGIAQVAAISTVPLTPEWNNAEAVKEGADRVPLSELPVAQWPVVSRDYFAVMNIPVRAGRLFQDDGEQESVAVISQSAAQALWPGEYPVGRRLRHWFAPRSVWLRVIGVVGNVRSLGLDQAPPPVIYRPYSQRGGTEFSVVLGTSLAPHLLLPAIRQQIWKVDPGMPVGDLRSMTEPVSLSVAGRRMQTALMGAFAAIAVLLAAIGVYGVVAYSVLQRRREIAVRIALGANQQNIRNLILRTGMKPVLVGLTIGIIAAASLARIVASLLFEVSAVDPITFLIGPLLLGVAGALPRHLAAQKASSIAPAIALQSE